MDFLEFGDALQEVRGAMNHGRLKLTSQEVIFKNAKTGKVDTIQTSDIDVVNWQRIAGAYGLRLLMTNGQMHRFGGLKETDQDKLSKFFSHSADKNLTEKDFSLKGWNWGTAKFTGSVLSFDVGTTSAFEIPLSNVSHCTTAKNEVTLEFHQNDDASVQLMELRFHIPTESGGDLDSVQAFRDNVMSKANVIQATGEAIATVKEVQCITPRGRYDIKLFPTFIQLHGKTFDYKIPMTTVLRLFLLPHKDQRQMFFVVSLDPPIKQGLTRYHFLILQFTIEEETTVELGISEEEIQEKYEGKIQKEMSGPTYEVISRIMKALVQRKITVPGNFLGNSGTPAVSCSYKAAAGFLYPLERGFIYVPKPPIHIRFEEVDSINFARSGGSTRSFDFEVEIKSGIIHTFSSIEKEEYGKLYDFITARKLRIKNKKQTSRDQPKYNDDDLVDSDAEDEPDAYLARVKAEAQERDVEAGDDSDDDESDVSFNPGDGSGSEVAEEYDSNAPSSESSDEEGGGGSDGGKEKKRKAKEKEHKPKKAKTVSETRKPRKKKEREEGKPKRPQSAYFIWLNENRERIKKENPGISIIDISRRAGEQWKEVTDKKKWEKLAEEAKKDYEKAMEEYRASGGGGGETSSKKEKKKKSSSAKESSKPKASSSSSPQKSGGAYKSKEYISSSEGSSDSDSGGKKKKASKEKTKESKKPEPKKEEKKAKKGKEEKEVKKVKEEKEEKVKEEKKDDDEEKMSDDGEEEEILSTPSSSEKDDASGSGSGEESGNDDGSD